MTKSTKSKAITLLSTAILATAGVSVYADTQDSVAPTDPSAGVVAPAPDTQTPPSGGSDSSATAPTPAPDTTPSTPANPDASAPSTPETTPPSTDTGSTSPDIPNVDNAGSVTTDHSKPSSPDVPNVNQVGGVKTDHTNPSITDSAVNKDSQGNITVKPQAVAPGQAVVGTQNGQLVVRDSAGNTRLADASEFGGQKNNNGTVSFKKDDGQMVTLPNTGEKGTLLTTVIGSIMSIAGLAVGIRKKVLG